MPVDQLTHLTALLPITVCADPVATACALDRLADLALFHGRAVYAERMAHRAAALREAGQ